MDQPSCCDLGLIGLAVMGQNLALNMNDHGFTVAPGTGLPPGSKRSGSTPWRSW